MYTKDMNKIMISPSKNSRISHFAVLMKPSVLVKIKPFHISKSLQKKLNIIYGKEK